MPSTEAKSRIRSLLRESPKSFEQISKALWLDEKPLIGLLKEMRQDKEIYRNANGDYDIVVLETQTPPLKKKKARPPKGQAGIIRVIFSVIAILSVIVSTRNTTRYLLETYPPLWGIMVGVTIALFLVSAFSAIVYFFGRGGWYTVIGGILIPIWLIVLICSMSATTIGMYNTQETTQAVSNSNEQKLFNQYTVQEHRLEALIASKHKSLDRYNTLIQNYTDEEHKKDYNALDSNIKAAEKYITDKTKELEDISKKKEQLLLSDTAIVINQKDAYSIMGLWFGYSAETVRFLLSVLFAIFIDIIAPVATGLALFINNRR